eukprot:1002497-Prymnesium_polylepis.1
MFRWTHCVELTGEAEKRSFFIPQSPQGRATSWVSTLGVAVGGNKRAGGCLPDAWLQSSRAAAGRKE